MAFETLLVERDGGVATVTFNRPKVLNALNSQTMDELRQVMLELRHDAGVRCVILTGAGDKAFVAGADINELAVQTPTSGREHALRGQAVLELDREPGQAGDRGHQRLRARRRLRAGHGLHAAGGGRHGAARPAGNQSRPLPGYAGTQRLARLVGRGRAMELLLTGRQITAEEAQRDRPGQPRRARGVADGEVRKLAGKLAAKAPVAMRYIIEAVNKGPEMPLADACAFEATLFGLVASTEDMREGTKAFLEKRKAEFAGK